MNEFWTLLLIGAIFGMAFTGLIGGMIWAISAIVKKLRPWVHLPDEEGGMGFLGRARMVDGHVVMGKGDNVKRYPVNVSGRSVTNNGIVYTLGRQTGANLRVPRTTSIRAALTGKHVCTEVECQDPSHGAVLMFDVADPGLLGRTYARRMAQETVDSQTEKEDWKKTAILPLSILLGLAIIVVGIALAVMAG